MANIHNLNKQKGKKKAKYKYFIEVDDMHCQHFDIYNIIFKFNFSSNKKSHKRKQYNKKKCEKL